MHWKCFQPVIVVPIIVFDFLHQFSWAGGASLIALATISILSVSAIPGDAPIGCYRERGRYSMEMILT